MSDSYAVFPVTTEVRSWLESEGMMAPPKDGKPLLLQDLRQLVSLVADVEAEWSNGPQFYDGAIRTCGGTTTTIIVGSPGNSSTPCEFHFQGGDIELIKKVVCAIARFAGPQVIYAHSGSYTEVIQ